MGSNGTTLPVRALARSAERNYPRGKDSLLAGKAHTSRQQHGQQGCRSSAGPARPRFTGRRLVQPRRHYTQAVDLALVPQEAPMGTVPVSRFCCGGPGWQGTWRCGELGEVGVLRCHARRVHQCVCIGSLQRSEVRKPDACK